MKINYYKIQGHGKKSIRGNRYSRYSVDRYDELDGKMVFAEHVAWHYRTELEAQYDLLRFIREDESRGYAVEVIA